MDETRADDVRGPETEEIAPTVVERNELTPDEYSQVLAAEAKIGHVREAIDDLIDNGVNEDSPALVRFGRRMATLAYHGGLSPSEAKVQAAVDTLRSGRTLSQLADLLGMTRGGLSKLKSSASDSADEARRLHYMQVNGPMNLLFDERVRAEPPADYWTRYVLMETIDPVTEPREESGVRPNPRVNGPDPTHCLVRETHAPGGNGIDLRKEPDERTYGTLQSTDVVWFANEGEVAEYLYENELFQTEERATEWRDRLEALGFSTESPPSERLHPDFQD